MADEPETTVPPETGDAEHGHRTDAHYRALFDALPLPVVVSRAADGSRAYSNPAFARLVKADPAALTGRELILERLHPDDLEKAARNIEAIVSGREPLDDPRYRIRTEDGTFVEVDIYAIPTEFEGAPAMFSIMLDATEANLARRERDAEEERALTLKRANTTLEEANAALEEASRAKSAFLASMSHELRTPLNSIIGFTGIMLQGLTGELTGEQRAQLQMVNRSGRQLLGLVSDVLDLEQIESGHTELDIEDLDVPRLVTGVADTVRPMAEDVGLTIQVDVGDAPERLRTDRRKLEQILLNLLSNAVKYTEEGGVAITVTRNVDGTVSFAVRDTGIGIAQEDQPLVFDEFRQLPARHGAKHPGSGLGLAISLQLAELLGGRIEVESAVGKGSTFTLVLPA